MVALTLRLYTWDRTLTLQDHENTGPADLLLRPFYPLCLPAEADHPVPWMIPPGASIPPLRLLNMEPLYKVESRFQELKALVDPPLPSTHSPRLQWIYQEYYRLIDARTSLRHHPYHNWNQAQYLTFAVQRYLTTDS